MEVDDEAADRMAEDKMVDGYSRGTTVVDGCRDRRMVGRSRTKLGVECYYRDTLRSKFDKCLVRRQKRLGRMHI
jgi:hypothetical protein